MRILGVDPGTVIIGYGVIDDIEGEIKAVSFGGIRCRQNLSMPERLEYLHRELGKIIELNQPDVVAIETPFVSDNVKTALAIGKAQAVAMLAASQRHKPVFEYSPASIKSHVADYGASTKEQVQDMVKLLLNLNEVPQPNDAADALAVAICHSRECRFRRIVAGTPG
jgi:crossover junction endodeoxyribonuclease RuvC